VVGNRKTKLNTKLGVGTKKGEGKKEENRRSRACLECRKSADSTVNKRRSITQRKTMKNDRVAL